MFHAERLFSAPQSAAPGLMPMAADPFMLPFLPGIHALSFEMDQ